jgi:hypothetical protein
MLDHLHRVLGAGMGDCSFEPVGDVAVSDVGGDGELGTFEGQSERCCAHPGWKRLSSIAVDRLQKAERSSALWRLSLVDLIKPLLAFCQQLNRASFSHLHITCTTGYTNLFEQTLFAAGLRSLSLIYLYSSSYWNRWNRWNRWERQF